MRAKEFKSRKKLVNILFGFVVFISCAMLLLRYFDDKIKPAAMEISVNQAKNETVTIINDAIINYILESDIEYSELVSILRDENGRIASIEILSSNVNRLQSELANYINDALSSKLNNTIDVPLGSASGVYIFSGRGPNIRVKLIPIGNVQTNIQSDFVSAGLNQTKHTIVMQISTEISAILPLHTEKIMINTSHVLAETIIIGEVPQNYLSFGNLNTP